MQWEFDEEEHMESFLEIYIYAKCSQARLAGRFGSLWSSGCDGVRRD